MPEDKFMVWLLSFSNACKFSDVRRKIPGVAASQMMQDE